MVNRDGAVLPQAACIIKAKDSKKKKSTIQSHVNLTTYVQPEI